MTRSASIPLGSESSWFSFMRLTRRAEDWNPKAEIRCEKNAAVCARPLVASPRNILHTAGGGSNTLFSQQQDFEAQKVVGALVASHCTDKTL